MKWKPTEFFVSSTEEFEDMVMNKDFRISSSIVEGIFANLEFSKVKSEPKPFGDFAMSFDSPILEQFEHLLKEQ